MIYLINLFSFSAFFLLGMSISLFMRPHAVSPSFLSTMTLKGNTSMGRKESLFLLRLFNPLNRPLCKLVNRQRWQSQLQTAKVGISPEEFLALKEIVLAITGVILYFLLGPHKIYWFIVVGLIGFMVPDIFLHLSIKKQRRMIIKALPAVLDMLTLSIEAGLDFMMALKMIIEQSRPNPFIEELAILYREIDVGKPRRQALQDMSRKLSIPEVSSFARALIQAERMGTSIADTLKMISEETSRVRFQRSERLALAAPLKMLIPLIFFILPVVMIIVGGPVIIEFIKGGIRF